MSGAIAEVLARLTCRLSISTDPVLADGFPPPPFIVAAAHASVADPIPVSAAIHRVGLPFLPMSSRRPGQARVRFLVTDVVWSIPVVSWVVARAGCIPVPRGRAEAAAAFSAAAQALESGDIVVIYPQGDLNQGDDGSPGPVLPGAVLLARRARVPVVPLAHHDARLIADGIGTRAAVAGVLRAMLRRPAVQVHIGAPIAVEELAAGRAAEAGELLRDRLTRCWVQARDRRTARAR